jgi:dihydropteroate synthase
MGIVNVTPDSFSDGGRFGTTEAAVAHALALLDEGAAVVDVGGESTRPGATPVDVSTERDRVVPVIEGIVAARPDTIVSIDTTKAEVAEAALVAGATIVNDVSASLESVAAAHGAGWIAMHAGGPSATMQNDPTYDDVVEEVHAFLVDAVARGQAAGVEQIWIDPGVGFRQDPRAQPRSRREPRPVHGARSGTAGCQPQTQHWGSARRERRHRHGGVPEPVPTDDRLEGSLAMATWGGFLGVDMVRVHDVRATVHAVGVIAR